MVTSTCKYVEIFLGGAYACSSPKNCPYKKGSNIEFEFESVSFCSAPGSNNRISIPPRSMAPLKIVDLTDRVTALENARVDLNSN